MSIDCIHTRSDTDDSCIMDILTMHWYETKVLETVTKLNAIMEGGKPQTRNV